MIKLKKLMMAIAGTMLAVGTFAANLSMGYTEYTHKSNTRIECSVNVAFLQNQSCPAVFGSLSSYYKSKAFVSFSKFDWGNTPVLCRAGDEQNGTNGSFIYYATLPIYGLGTLNIISGNASNGADGENDVGAGYRSGNTDRMFSGNGCWIS